MKTNLFLAAALVAAALPANADARPLDGFPAVAVTYKDLDLGSEAGRQSLESRIRGAVKRVCGHVAGGGIRDFASHRICIRQSSAAGLAQARLAVARANISGAALAAR